MTFFGLQVQVNLPGVHGVCRSVALFESLREMIAHTLREKIHRSYVEAPDNLQSKKLCLRRARIHLT